jgi:hypothetical protein
MLADRKAYETKLDAQLAQWDADLNVLKAMARRAEVDAMVSYDQAIDALQRKHEEAGVYLGKLKAATDETWECAKAGTEKSWYELKAMFHGSAEKP